MPHNENPLQGSLKTHDSTQHSAASFLCVCVCVLGGSEHPHTPIHHVRKTSMVAAARVDSVWHLRWPLFCVYPLSAAFFWVTYLKILPSLSARLLGSRYSRFNEFNQRCWRQNLLSGLHTMLSCACLLAALVADPDMLGGGVRGRIEPRDSLLLYLDISMSLGYFSFSLPMSVVMAKAGFPYGSKVMVAHHTFVAVAQGTFLLTQYPSGYMAASGFLFELTNVFFIPYVILVQLGAAPALRTALGLSLVITYTLARCVVCTVLCIMSLFDLRSFAPPAESAAASWRATLLGLGCLYGLLAISWYWYITAVLPMLHQGLQLALGEEYYRACVPEWLRRLTWRYCTEGGREERRMAAERLRVLQELREEQEHDPGAIDAATDDDIVMTSTSASQPIREERGARRHRAISGELVEATDEPLDAMPADGGRVACAERDDFDRV